MRLYEKAKKSGQWDPYGFDFYRDKQDWKELGTRKRRQVLYYLAQFQGGEEAVTLDLLPLIHAVARSRPLEDQLYMTSFLFDEGRHVQFFRLWLDDVAESPSRLEAYQSPAWRRIFDEELPAAMNPLLEGHGAAAFARACVTYNLIVEGVLAQTGYHACFVTLSANDLFPALRAGLTQIRRDESRHIAFGIYLLSRLVAEEPTAWGAIEERMRELLPLCLATVEEGFAASSGTTPLGTTKEAMMEFVTRQFWRRFASLRRACLGSTRPPPRGEEPSRQSAAAAIGAEHDESDRS